jgi:VanZ family protein
MKNKTNANKKRIVPVQIRIIFAVCAIFGIIYFSIVPPPGSGAISSGPMGIIPYSYWLHFGSYAGLAVLLGYATAHIPRPEWQLWVFFVTVGTGTTIELIQYTIPARTFSMGDISINIIGVSSGILLITVFDGLTCSAH